MVRKRWTIADTCQVVEAVIANQGKWFTPEQFEELAQRVDCSRGSIEPMVWRLQTVLGYPVTSDARGISALDRAVAQLYLEHDSRLKVTKSI